MTMTTMDSVADSMIMMAAASTADLAAVFMAGRVEVSMVVVVSMVEAAAVATVKIFCIRVSTGGRIRR